MWLLPFFSTVSRIAARIYYRLDQVGGAVPATGPVLLVSNHPNSLIDPVIVIAAAGRPVRFLAKAPLFDDPKVGWLVRGSGSIPVYRRSDDPALVSRNEEMFSAVHDALADGSAVAIFPEGISHSEPGMTSLKTGAARIALGYARERGGAFPIIPVGLVFRAKDVFRSEAQVIVGEPVEWGDVAGRDTEDTVAVQELTSRIERTMRRVTVNLDAWEDQPLVEYALDVWEAVHPDEAERSARVARLRTTIDLLREVRDGGDPDLHRLVSEVRNHARRLAVLKLSPGDLTRDTGPASALRWSVRRLTVLSPPAIVLAVAGQLLFWVPFRITGLAAATFRTELDRRATYKLLIGIPVYALWVLVIAVGVAVAWGPLALLGALLGAPTLGMVALWIRERWRGAREDARRFIFIRAREELIADLRARQHDLGRELDAVYRRRRGPNLHE